MNNIVKSKRKMYKYNQYSLFYDGECEIKLIINDKEEIYKEWKFNNSIIGISTLVVSRKFDICLTKLQRYIQKL